MSILSIKAVRYGAFALAAVTLFALGLAAGRITAPEPEAGQDALPLNGTNAEDEAAAVDTEHVKRVTVTTGVEWLCRFTACEHTIEKQGDDLIGMSRAETEKSFPQHTVEEFSERRVVLSRTVEGCCHRHIFAKLEGGDLVIKRADEGSDELREFIRISSNRLTLPDALRAELSKGVAFESLEEINSCLESMES